MGTSRSLFSRITESKLALFLCFWLCIVAIYLPSYKAGFISDFLGMYPDIERIPFWDFIHRNHAQVKSFYEVTQLQMYAFIKLFGTHYIPWYLIITGLHAINGLLVFRFFRNLFRDFSISNAALVALAGTLLFLFNPNITEVTVWKGGYHYLTGIMMQIGILLWCQRFFETRQPKYAVYAFIFFAISIFTLEIFYVTPALTFSLILGYYWRGNIDKQTMRSGFLYFFVPQLVLFIVHLLMFRLLYGSWVAHYGVTSTFTITANDILPRIGKYLAYILLMTSHLPEKTRVDIYSLVSIPAVYYSILAIIALSLLTLIIRFKKLSGSWQVAAFLLIGVVASGVLVVPIFFDDLFSLYNSRRCYQLGLFIYMLLCLGIFGLIKNRVVATTMFGLYLAVCLVFTVKMALTWRTAAKVQYGILRTFSYQQSDPVLLLNVPTYYHDIRIMPVSPYNEFNEQLKTFGHDTIKGKLYEVSSYNMQDTWNGAHVTVLDSNTIKVTLNQWGTWWMYNYVGAGDSETDLYQVKMTDPGHEYILKLKSKPANMAILFLQDIYWRKVDMNKSGEQW